MISADVPHALTPPLPDLLLIVSMPRIFSEPISQRKGSSHPPALWPQTKGHIL